MGTFGVDLCITVTYQAASLHLQNVFEARAISCATTRRDKRVSMPAELLLSAEKRRPHAKEDAEEATSTPVAPPAADSCSGMVSAADAMFAADTIDRDDIRISTAIKLMDMSDCADLAVARALSPLFGQLREAGSGNAAVVQPATQPQRSNLLARYGLCLLRHMSALSVLARDAI